MTKAKNPGANAGRLICRYLYTEWIEDDGRLSVKVEGIQWERATLESYRLAARRRAQRWLLANGFEPNWALDRMEVWDVANDWADGLVRAVTYRSRDPLPDRGDVEAVA